LGTPLQDIRDSYASLLSFPDEELWVVDFICSLALFAKHPNPNRDTVMGCIIGPSSSGKTLALRPFMKWPGFSIEFEDQTENAANSGSPTITNTFVTDAHRRVVVCKEMTTIINSRPEKRHAFLSTLRGAADGSVSKRSGAMNQSRDTRSRFTFIGGGTDMMWDHMDEMQDMGHRFLFFQLWKNRLHDRAFFRKLQFKLARAGSDDQDRLIHTPLRTVVRHAFNRLRLHYTPPDATSCVNPVKDKSEHPKDYTARMENHAIEKPTGWDKVVFPEVTRTEEQDWFFVELSDLVTVIRSGSYDERDVQKRADLPMRVGNQLRDLASFRAVSDLRTNLNNLDISFSRRIAQDTVDPCRFSISRELYRGSTKQVGGITLDEIVKTVGRAHGKVTSILTHYVHNGLAVATSQPVKHANGAISKATRYQMSPEYTEIAERTGFFSE
jgi:hypothetical protein